MGWIWNVPDGQMVLYSKLEEFYIEKFIRYQKV